MKPLRGVLFALLFGCAFGAAAQTYPARPISLVVAFSAGGPTDSIARIVAARMSGAIGQTVVVENTTGAGGTIGVGRIAKGTPDGYLLGIGHIGTHVVNGAIYQLPYDLQTDLEPVALIATNPQILIARNAIPATNLKEFLAWEKANHEKASAGTGGAGTPAHVSAVYFQNITNTKPQIVHYRGAAPAMQDILAGQIDFMFDQAASSLPQIRAGKVRPLAVTAKTRLTAAPEIPTVDEAGLPGFYMAVWHGLWAPRGTPRPIIDRINAALVETLADPGVRTKLGDIGQEIPPREQQTPEALRAHHKAEIEKWWPVIKQAKIKVD